MPMSPEQKAADELTSEVLRRCNGKTVSQLAAIAQVQAVLVNAAMQATIEVLLQKGIISQHELAGALKHHYNKAHDTLTHSNDSGLIVPGPPPVARPV